MKPFLTMLGTFVLSLLMANGQTVDWEKVEKLSASSLEPCMSGRSVYPNWIKGTSCFYYDVKQGDTNTYYLFDARTGRKTPLVKDIEGFINRYARLTGDTLDSKAFHLSGLSFRDGRTDRFYISHDQKTLVCDIRKGTLSLADQPASLSGHEVTFSGNYHSPDSAFTMMGSGYNLFVRDNRTGQVKQVTTDGKENASYTYRFANDTLPSHSRGFWLGHRYLYLLKDQSEVQELSLINSLTPGRPRTNTFKMPMPGDAGVNRYRLFWYDADKGEGRLLPIDKYPDQEVDLGTYRSNEALYFTRRNRRADSLDLCRVNVAEGTVTEVISETVSPHINLTLSGYRVLLGGKRILWWSERTGKGHYYLYDSQGRLLNRVTQGYQLVAGNILRIDSARNEIVFAGYGNEPGINPYYTFYYKASLDGKKQTLLTPGNGNHELSLSPDGRYAVDKYSRVDCLPVTRALSVEHPSRSHLVEEADGTALLAAGWRPPVLLKLKAADGQTDLYGIMYLPSDLDPGRKYPLITNVYPGPQDDQIPQSFVIDDNGNQSLAELGFIVINVAPRGSSPLRGRDFYCYGYGNLRDYPLADTKHVIEELAKTHPYIDLDRVGIYGHSGGGFQTVAAMLTYPDFFKVGVAASGNHDNNIYIQWWGEIFHGVEARQDSVTRRTVFTSKIPTNMELAANLQGDLLLITGDVDKNVPPSSTYRLAHALIKANKRFDMFVLPGKDHGVMDEYYINLIRYYFVEHLLQASHRDINLINHQ